MSGLMDLLHVHQTKADVSIPKGVINAVMNVGF